MQAIQRIHGLLEAWMDGVLRNRLSGHLSVNPLIQQRSLNTL
jgi:hypothetical protein